MQFNRELRDRVKSGEITSSVRIWKQPRVKVGNQYRLGDGHIVIDRHGATHISGVRGPWEMYASGNGLGAMAREWAEEGRLDVVLAQAGDGAGQLHAAWRHQHRSHRRPILYRISRRHRSSSPSAGTGCCPDYQSQGVSPAR